VSPPLPFTTLFRSHRGVRQTFLPIASPELHVAIQIPVPELFRCRAIVRLFWLIWGLILILKPLFRPNAQLLWNAVINFDRMKNGISSALRFLPNLCVIHESPNPKWSFYQLR